MAGTCHLVSYRQRKGRFISLPGMSPQENAACRRDRPLSRAGVA